MTPEEEYELMNFPIAKTPEHCCLRCLHSNYYHSTPQIDDSGWYCNYYNDLPYIRDLSHKRPDVANDCENYEQMYFNTNKQTT